jgi:hypothetical protein
MRHEYVHGITDYGNTTPISQQFPSSQSSRSALSAQELASISQEEFLSALLGPSNKLSLAHPKKVVASSSNTPSQFIHKHCPPPGYTATAVNFCRFAAVVIFSLSPFAPTSTVLKMLGSEGYEFAPLPGLSLLLTSISVLTTVCNRNR